MPKFFGETVCQDIIGWFRFDMCQNTDNQLFLSHGMLDCF